jgi:hypothetical protein
MNTKLLQDKVITVLQTSHVMMSDNIGIKIVILTEHL